MKIKIFFAIIAFSALVSTSSYAQYNPYSSGAGILSVGVGASGWGIPVFIRYEQPVADNITVGGNLSFQTYSESINYKWKHTIVGVNARGSYHFNELLEVPNEWDFYAGASLGYYIWNTKNDGPTNSFVYGGSGPGGLSLGAHLGARYYFKDNVAFNIELGGGSVLAGGTIGVSFLL